MRPLRPQAVRLTRDETGGAVVEPHQDGGNVVDLDLALALPLSMRVGYGLAMSHITCAMPPNSVRISDSGWTPKSSIAPQPLIASWRCWNGAQDRP